MLIGETWQQLTLFVEDTPASPSASQDKETEPMTLDTFGRGSQTLLGFFDPDTHCWKTSQGTLISDSQTFLQTWPRAGMTHNGIAYQQPASAHRTCATAYSLSLHATMEWTPTAKANQMSPSMQSRNPGLRWPTPTAHMAKEGGHPAEGRRNTPTLTWQAGNGGKLNPAWVEWLMGFPAAWTDLED